MKGFLNHSIAIGEFEVHPSLNQLVRQGKTIRVTPKVMQVLVCLAQRPNQAVTRDQLLDAAWPDVSVNEDVLTSAISELRRIFQDNPRSPAVIETLPKTGYRLIAPVKPACQPRALAHQSATETVAAAEVDRPVQHAQKASSTRWLLPVAFASVAIFSALLVPWPWLSSTDAALDGDSTEDALLPAAPQVHFRELKAADYYREGLKQYLQHDFLGNENAIALFKKALQADPDFALAYAGLADGFSQRVSNFLQSPHWADLALQNAQQAVRMAPERPETHKALGLAYASKGHRQVALKHLGRAVEAGPNHFSSIYNLALLHHRTGDLGNAALWLRKAWKLDSGHPLIMTLLGEIHSQLDDYDQAEMWFRRALEFEPMNGRHHAGLGVVEWLKGNRDGVTEGCRRILQTFPGEPYCLLLIGEAELMQGNRSQARHSFERAYRNRSYLQYARFRLAQVAWLDGDMEKAEELFEQTLAVQLDKLSRLENGGDWSDNWIVAAIHAVRGNRDEAFVWLERTRKAGRTHSGWDMIEPAFSELRGDRRFDSYLASLKEKGQAIRAKIRQAETRAKASED